MQNRNGDLSVVDIIKTHRCKTVVGEYRNPETMNKSAKVIQRALNYAGMGKPERTILVRGKNDTAINGIVEWANDRKCTVRTWYANEEFLYSPYPNAMVGKNPSHRITMIAILRNHDGCRQVVFHTRVYGDPSNVCNNEINIVTIND